MTKKHFVFMASLVKELNDGTLQGITDARIVADLFVKLAQRSNDRFDTERFMSACGL